ncbi:MAG: hypothetical protein KKD47_01255 [Proteobacteria bacterium]|nr:hypothetical protein [Pseudomonadota bacterium]
MLKEDGVWKSDIGPEKASYSLARPLRVLISALYSKGIKNLIVHCTQKLLTELKKKPTEEKSGENPFWSWHGNVFYIERHKCVLISNDITRYALFIPSLKRQDFESFHFVFGQYLFKNLLHEKISQRQIEGILFESENIKYEKTNNRSVLGTMNEQKNLLEYIVHEEGGLARTDVYKLNHELNQIILSAIDYKHPLEIFKEKLKEITSTALRLTP